MNKILVVDDNQLLCQIACEILENEGYKTVSVNSAEAALQALQHEEFDLVVTDFRMPGMNGLELAQAIRQKDPRFPVIVMSAYEQVHCEHVSLWLPKEYLFPDLLDGIRRFLAEKRILAVPKSR